MPLQALKPELLTCLAGAATCATAVAADSLWGDQPVNLERCMGPTCKNDVHRQVHVSKYVVFVSLVWGMLYLLVCHQCEIGPHINKILLFDAKVVRAR